MGLQKTNLYRDLLERQSSAIIAGYHYEACWFAHAIFEDRTRSIIINSDDGEGSGGTISEKLTLILKRLDAKKTKVVKGRPQRLQGKKVKIPKHPHLHTLKRTDILVIKRWTTKRNTLVHRLASGQLSLSDADAMSVKLSLLGERRGKELCAAARRVKKYNRKDN